MLQTLKTRVAPFLVQRFDSYQELLRVLTDSEKRFAERTRNRVLPIDAKFLVNMLPEIEAAVRAAVISPYEDAKEKLSKLSRLVIRAKDEDGYLFEIRLRPTGTLSLEELQQSFQLLEMSALDDSVAAADERTRIANESWVARIREKVVLVLRLAEVFQELFASGCITYTFEGFNADLEDLEREIGTRKDQLDNWIEHWKRMEDMPHLCLFSREYLLYLANLVYRNQTKESIATLRMFLPLATVKLEKSVAKLVAKFAETGGDDRWMSTETLFELFRQLNEIIQEIFHEAGAQQEIPAFLAVYGRNLQTHFLDKAIQILNVRRELVVGSALAAYIAVTRRLVDPSRILFVTANTDTEEVSRFMTLWSVAGVEDFFVVVHIERLSTSAASAVRDGVARVVPERRARLLLLAQHHYQIQATKS